MKYRLLQLLIFVVFISAKAQTNCNNAFVGKVLDSETSKALEAIITIEGIANAAITSSNGSFKIDNLCAGTHNYIVSLLGYETQKSVVAIPQADKLVIKLKPSIQNLSTFTKVEHKREEMEALGKVTLKEIELTKAQGASIAEGLKSIAGVSTLSTGNNVIKPVIHGMHSNRILVLNNGIRQEGQNWGSEHAPEIDPYIATNLSVIKGANAVRYGSDAIAGVILVEPKKLSEINDLGGEVNLAGFSNGLGGATSTIIEYCNKKVTALKVRLQGTLRELGNANTPNYLLNNTGAKEKNYTAAVGWIKENYGVDYFTSNFNSEIGLFTGSHVGNLTDLENAFANSTPRSEYIGKFTYNIDRPKQVINHNLHKVNAYFYTVYAGKFSLVYANQNNTRSEYDAHRPRNAYEPVKNNPELKFSLNTQTLDFIWEHNPAKGFSGSIGVNGMMQNNSYTGRNLIPNFIMQSGGLFAIEHYVKGKFELELGARYDKRWMRVIKRNKNNTLSQPTFNYNVPSATIGVVYNYQKIIIKSYVGTAFRAPAINELFINGVHHGNATFETGDENLKAEKAYNASVNFIYNSNSFLNAELELYSNYIRDYIYLQPTKPAVLTVLGAFPTFSFKQTNARLSGLDATISLKFLKNLQYTIKASVLYARNLSSNSWIELMPPNRLDNGLKFNLPKNVVLETNAVYTMRQTRTNTNVDYAAAPNAYTLFSCNFSKTFNIKKTKIAAVVGCNNIFNTVYRDYMNSFRYYADDLGRNIHIKIKLTF